MQPNVFVLPLSRLAKLLAAAHFPKNSYIAAWKWAHLVNCSIRFHREIVASSEEDRCSGKPGPSARDRFPVPLERLPPGEWHFVRLRWLVGPPFLVHAYWPLVLRLCLCLCREHSLV